GQMLQAVFEQIENDPPRLGKAGFGVNGAQQGLDGIGQNGVATAAAVTLFAGAEHQQWPQLQLAREDRQRAATHQRRTQPRQIALAGVRTAVKQRRGNDEIEYAVTKELQPLVVDRRRT